ncbi:A-kinase anchor protein 13 isoform X2 [Denticeps clupeoides]|uniref:A-kinase anchor protein 13 isoform X2 n=1 Tax=Denticeps clupeoides TaxID=299321 RepID=UPI0010A3F7C9|nr:A-kinase anchor protein 13 isoform X2 [Denticeps clupeoides]
MKLNPHQAPLYGKCLLTVQLCETELAEDADCADFYLLFTGSTQRHLTSTRRADHATLHAVCPAHNCCESVQVSLCLSTAGGPVAQVAQVSFRFVQDLVFDMAQFLVSAAGQVDGLDGVLLLDECHIPLLECERLDRGLALALRHLTLPEDWRLLGNGTEAEPQETLLHFATRRGLHRVASFLLKLPGGREALSLPNKDGDTPVSLAESRGHQAMLELFRRAETAEESRTDTLRQISSGARVVQHHPTLNTYTLSVGAAPGEDAPSLQADVQELCHLIGCHAESKGGASAPQQPGCQHIAQECGDGPETNTACSEQHDSLGARAGGPSGGSGDGVGGAAPGPGASGHREEFLGENAGGDYSAETGARRVSGEREDAERAQGGSEGPCGENRGEEEEEEEEQPDQKHPSVSGRTADTAQVAGMGLTQSAEDVESSGADSRESDGEGPRTSEVPPGDGASTDDGEEFVDAVSTTKEHEDPTPRFDTDEEPEEPCPLERDGSVQEGDVVQVPNSSDQCSDDLCLDIPQEVNDDVQMSEGELTSGSTETSVVPEGQEPKEALSPMCDSGCDLPSSLTTDPDGRSTDEAADGSEDSQPLDESPSETLEHQLASDVDSVTDAGSDVLNPDGDDSFVSIISLFALDTSEEAQDATPLNAQDGLGDDVNPEPSGGVEANSDVSLNLSGDESESQLASSEDTLEALDAESSTLSDSDHHQSPPKGLPESRCGHEDESSAEGDIESSHQSAVLRLETVDEEERRDACEMHSNVFSSNSTDADCVLNSEPVAVSSRVAEETTLEELVEMKEVSAVGLGLQSENSCVDEAACLSEETKADVPDVDATVPEEDRKSSPLLPETLLAGDAEPSSGVEVPAEVPEDCRTSEKLSSDAPCPSPENEDVVATTQELPESSTDTECSLSLGTDTHWSLVHREKDFVSSSTLLKESSVDATDSPQSTRSSISTLQRDSGSDIDGFCSTDTGEDNVFRKGDERVTGDSTSEVSVSCSSTDDATSLGHPSSSTSESAEDAAVPGTAQAAGAETEEEAKDRVSEVPLRSTLFRSSVRSLSPFRRHSWGPGKNAGGDAAMTQRSSIRSLGKGRPAFHRRSLSWCPSEVPLRPVLDQISDLSLSLEGLAVDVRDGKRWEQQAAPAQQGGGGGRQESEDRGSLVSLTEEEHESDLGDCSSLDSQSRRYRPTRRSSPSLSLTKSVSLLSISGKDIDAVGRVRQKRRISFAFNLSPLLSKPKTVFSYPSSSSDDDDDDDRLSLSSFSSTSASLGYRITEEEPLEGKGGTKVSRTFSYLKSKMYKKTREKEKERSKEKEAREKERRTVNGHLFSPVCYLQPSLCPQCHKALSTKEAFLCTNCNVCVHKGCRENLPLCAKVKMKQTSVPDSAIMPSVTLRSKTLGTRERPRSAIFAPEDSSLMLPPRRHTLMPFNSTNLSKSISISNIAGPVFDDISLKGLRYLSQSTDSLNKPSKVNESTESLIDEGTEMIDSLFMGEFEADAKELEADAWSVTVDEKFLKRLKKEVIQRQDVIYELIQTELHHVRTLRIMAEVYVKGLLKEAQLEPPMVDRMFPVVEDLLELHTHFLFCLLERRREAQQSTKDGSFLIGRIGDVLVNQFSGSNADTMKRVYGKFCSRHTEAINLYKEQHAKDKRFQVFIKKTMGSSVVRRMGIPDCILLVTQRITKYPVLLQRILRHTGDKEEDHPYLSDSLRLVKEVIAVVDGKVSEHEKKRRLKDIHGRMDSRSIMRMRSGQMFAREDLVRGRKLLRDGPLQLKNSAGRFKDVQALLLSDVLVFLQEKDQKYVFASLDQRATVISLQKLIVREVANEEKALFLITAGTDKPEMVEVHTASREERNAWMQLLQDAMQSIEKDEDEGIPSETEEDRRLMESKAKEIRDMLQKKDEEIMALLQEKMKLFHDMCDCSSAGDGSPAVKMMFRASSSDVPKGEPLMKDAMKEVEMLQMLVNGSLGAAVGQQVAQEMMGGVGPVSLPRRAETFGGFDSHQISKHGGKEEGEDAADLRRTESDSVLKKGGNNSLLLLLRRNSEHILQSVTNLHDLLASLQAVVVQQDTVIENQRQALTDRQASRPSSRPNSLIEQEKQRSMEKQRQELASLHQQQAAYAEQRRRREHDWEAREQEFTGREVLLHQQEEETQRKRSELAQARQELQRRKEDYQRDLERLRDAQRRLDRDREQLHREVDRMEQLQPEKRVQRTPSSTSDDSLHLQSGSSLEREPGEGEPSTAPRRNSLGRMDSKTKGRNLNPFSLKNQGPSGDGQNQIPSRLLQLAKSKDKKDKKKKKSKTPAESQLLPLTEPSTDGEIFYC